MALGAAGRARLLGVAVVVLTFTAGGLGGAAVERLLSAREPASISSRDRARGEIECEPRRSGNERRRSPYDALDLSADQKVQIDAVLQSQSARMDSVWRGSRPRMDSIIEQTRADVRALLTPSQIDELDRRRAERARQDSIRREEYRKKCGTPVGSGDSPRGVGPQSRNR